MDETTNSNQGNWFDEFLGSVSAGIRVYQADRAAATAAKVGLAHPTTTQGFPWLAVGLLAAVVYMVWE